jgi:arylsulfatase A-like enzyme
MMRALAVLALLVPSQEAKRPNVVFILADDLGWTDVACYGSGYYETPNIDRLATQGMRFTQYCTNGPNCQPTRAALMTGRYGPRTGVYTVGTGARGEEKFRNLVPPENRTELPLSERTLAQALKAAGYATGMFGKWHLGQQGEQHPAKRGFDVAVETMGKHFEFRTNPPQKVEGRPYLADWLADRAVGFIESNREKPFFLYLPHFGVHSPHDAKPEYVPAFREKKPEGGHKDPVYAAMIRSVDESVGRVMAKLDELKLAENTILIFSSDNGGVGGITDNSPLRGAKGMLYEGGFRVPFIIRWPGVVKPGTACAEAVASIDVFPTLLEAAGGKSAGVDGLSLLPLLRDPSASLGRDALYWHFPGYLEANVKQGTWRTTPAGAVRAGDWKLHEFFETGKLELYNLKDDPGERNDLAAAMPERAKELHAKLAAWRTSVNAPMPSPK